MSKLIAGLQRSLKLKLKRAFLDGGANRQLQEQIDIHRLFLFTSLHAQKQLLAGRLPDGFTEGLIEQAKALSFEQQRHFVHQQLRQQLVDIASSIHDSLLQAQDPAPAAAALEQAWQQMHPQLHSSSSSSSSSSGSGALLSQQQLSELVQQRLGYSLSVRPSNITHQAAGMGLFLEGAASPGSLLALFPGLVYHKPVYRRMAGYPRIDAGNPYLTARYDHGIVDSLPWGRGWLADGRVSAAAGAAAAAAASPAAPASKGLIGRMVAASDGPRKPIPGTTWVNPTTAEAAQLEMLEGRHPLALAHYANHPPAGAAPNAVIANFSFKLPAATTSPNPSGSSSSSDQATGSQLSSSSSAAPRLRAYVPNIDYVEECSQQHLLNTEVSCVGLVAVAPLQSGSEVLFNYRLSPALLGRPAWYTPVDQDEENMRWA